MIFLPLLPLLLLLLGLLSLALLGFGIFFIVAWFMGTLVGLAPIIAGTLMTLFSFLGRPIILMLLRRPGDDEPNQNREGAEVQRIKRPDGTELQVEMYGPPNGQPIVLTHGWGPNSTEWYYVKRRLATRFRLIVWDLPGTGLSSRPGDNIFELERLAGHLEAVLALAGGRPAILVGHSIGGMIQQTFSRLFPTYLGRQVSGVVMLHTTYTNPVKTASLRGLLTAIQKPILTPLMYLTIALWPLIWLMNWLSYFNGTAHLASAVVGFAGTETRGQLDLGTRYTPQINPGVLARGMLAMFKFDETETLRTINVPVLVIAGDLDRLTNPDASEHMAGAMPNAQLLVLRPSGHMGNFERNAELTSALETFAAANSGTPAATVPMPQVVGR
jgi:pimeloyl-ACP methyl ester carboxylesterase